MRTLVLLALLAAGGCSAPPWATGAASSALVSNGGSAASPNPAAAPQTAGTTGAAGNPSQPATRGAIAQKPDPRAVDELVARIAERESLDPAAKAKLADDLRQTDPALWPALMQYFQAAVAYRRQVAERELSAAGPSPERPAASPPDFAVLPADAAASPGTAPSTPSAREVASGLADLASGRAAGPPPCPAPLAAPGAPGAPLPEARSEPRDGPPRLLAAGENRAPARGEREAVGQRAEGPPDKSDGRPPARPSADNKGVVAASYVAPTAPRGDPWQDHLDMATKALEAELRQAPPSSGDVAKQARLRLLYLAANRREDAVRPIRSVSPAVQDFWSQEMYGLAAWLDAERTTDPARRAAEARQQLSTALCRLGELAPLGVRNLTFVKEVKSYGDITPFEKTEFAPGQEVLLYAEVENFKSEEDPKGFQTEFRGSYEIFDARGQRVSAQELGKTSERCRNPRRDFFVIYDFRLPKRIYPGKHTLQLTVEDLKSQKIGQSSVDFSIKTSE